MRKRLLLATVGVLFAGCGGDAVDAEEKRDYEQQTRAIIAGYSSDVFKLSTAISRAPTPELATNRIVLLETRLEGAADRLETIDPPDDVADEHERLAASIRDLQDEVAKLEDDAAVELRDFIRLEDSFDAITGSDPAREVARAAQEIDAAGYDVIDEG